MRTRTRLVQIGIRSFVVLSAISLSSSGSSLAQPAPPDRDSNHSTSAPQPATDEVFKPYVFQMKYLLASRAQEIVEAVFRFERSPDSVAKLDMPAHPVGRLWSIARDDNSNVLICVADSTGLQTIRLLVDQLDTGGDLPKEIQLIELARSVASNDARLLESVFKPTTTGEPIIKIAADDLTHSLVIQAPAHEMKTAMQIVHWLERAPATQPTTKPGGPPAAPRIRGTSATTLPASQPAEGSEDAELEIKRRVLNSIDANNVAKIVNEVFRDDPSFPSAHVALGRLKAIVVEPQTNTVFIAGDRKALEKIDGLINLVEPGFDLTESIKVFNLKYCDASEAAQALDQIFKPQPSVFDPQFNVRVDGASLQAFRVTAAPHENMVIVRAGIQYMGSVQTVIDYLEENGRKRSHPESPETRPGAEK